MSLMEIKVPDIGDFKEVEVIEVLVKPGDTIVHSGPLYAATETLIGRVLGKFGVKWLDFPAGATREEIDRVMTEAATGNVALIYLESPANPTNALVDVQAVRASRDAIFADAANPDGAAALMALLASPAAAKAYGDGGLVSRLPHS